LNNQPNKSKNILFWIVVLFAIHCKEWAYMLPFIAICILKITNTKIDKFFWIGFILTIVISLGLRYIVLGHFIGGYENGQSLNLSVISLHTLAYLIKFTTYIRFASTEFLPLPMLVLISITISTYLIWRINKDQIKKSTILYFLLIIFLSLLPVAGLEITSFLSNQSDRYSYFALVPFSLIYGYIIINLNKWVSIFSLLSFSLLFSFFTIDYNYKWVDSSKAQYTFLQELSKEVDNDSSVLLFNVPDTYNDIYCLRNGIEPFLKVNGKIVDIEIYQRQDFHSEQSGSLSINDAEFKPFHAQNMYTTFPKDVISQNEIPFDWSWTEEFDQSLIYSNQHFNNLSK
jgi:hypothetical protein